MNTKHFLLTLVLAVTTLGASAQLLYRISGKDLTAPSYILGTYHLAHVSFVDSIPGLRQAMADCGQVYGELMMNEMMAPDSLALMQQAMMLPEGMTLDKLLTEDEMSRLTAYIIDLFGMDIRNQTIWSQMNKMTPTALSTSLSLIN